MPTQDETALASRSAEAFWRADSGTRAMGIEVTRIDLGSAEAVLTLADNHLNGHGTGHGGVVTYLAVVAFGYAANSHNRKGYGQQTVMNFLAPTHPGDVLTAKANLRHKSGKSAVYDVEIHNQDDVLVAMMRATARLGSEPWVEAEQS